MGMPVIASGTGSRFQAITDIVTSVALGKPRFHTF